MHKSIFAVLLVLALAPAAHADMGQIHATGVAVSEDSQKAIILHNLEEEVLILGTDLRAEKKTGIIRFIPFPAEPTVELAPGDSFKAAMDLARKHRLAYVYQTKGSGTASEGVELRFSRKLGAHDVTVVKVNDVGAFRQWVNDYFKSKGQPVKKSYPDIEAVAQDYVKRGIVYFVFDFVELTPETRFIEPLAYRFRSPKLYYPLKTSNTFGGEGGIDLILLTPRTACHPLDYSFEGCFGLRNSQASTSAKVTAAETGQVYPPAAEFFKGQNIYLQTVRYYGSYQFDHDVLFDLRQGFNRAFSAEEFTSSGPNPFEELERSKD